MIYLELSVRAKKEFGRLDKISKNRVNRALDHIQEFLLPGKKLSGELSGYYSYKIPPLRVIYVFSAAERRLLVISVGYRGDIYKKL